MFLLTRYGRIGDIGAMDLKSMGKDAAVNAYTKMLAEKQRANKGYTLVQGGDDWVESSDNGSSSGDDNSDSDADMLDLTSKQPASGLRMAAAALKQPTKTIKK